MRLPARITDHDKPILPKFIGAAPGNDHTGDRRWRFDAAHHRQNSPGLVAQLAVELVNDVVAVPEFAQGLFEIPLNMPGRSAPFVRQVHLLKELQAANHQPPIIRAKADVLGRRYVDLAVV
jgi:hypothetical protein